jgi:hypothetical protein
MSEPDCHTGAGFFLPAFQELHGWREQSCPARGGHLSARCNRGGQCVRIRMASCERQPVVVHEGHKFFRKGLGVYLRRHLPARHA